MRLRAIFSFLVAATAAAASCPRPAAAADDPAYLARAGDCVSCHTAPSGKPFAGGLRMTLPIGAIYTTNITPDKETGIGDYSFADFDRALRRGVGKDGHHLYPAMPYPSYARISDADMRGLYDFVMHQVAPVHNVNRRADLPWPLDMRWPLAIWNWLHLPAGRFRPDPGRAAVWNRGAYLVETLAHCGACHTPRGSAWNELAMADDGRRYLSGERLEYWSAPDLRGDVRTGLGGWSSAETAAFLKQGHNARGAAFGAMNYVTANSTPYLTDADLAAIATYLKSLAPGRAGERPYVYDAATAGDLRAGRRVTPGALLYLGYCAGCHGADGVGRPGRVPPLAGSQLVLDPDPSSVLHIVLDGGVAMAAGRPVTDVMPPFRGVLDDTDLAALASFVRGAWGNDAGWVGTGTAARVRAGTAPAAEQIARGRLAARRHGCGACHAIAGIPGATGQVGPPLDGIGARSIIAGMVPNDPDRMADWLQHPQRIKPGDAMPDLGLNRGEALDIAAFLATQRK